MRKELPEMPDARRARFIEKLELPEYDAGLLTLEKATADYFEAVVAAGADAKTASNWILGDMAKKRMKKAYPLRTCLFLPNNWQNFGTY